MGPWYIIFRISTCSQSPHDRAFFFAVVSLCPQELHEFLLTFHKDTFHKLLSSALSDPLETGGKEFNMASKSRKPFSSPHRADTVIIPCIGALLLAETEKIGAGTLNVSWRCKISVGRLNTKSMRLSINSTKMTVAPWSVIHLFVCVHLFLCVQFSKATKRHYKTTSQRLCHMVDLQIDADSGVNRNYSRRSMSCVLIASADATCNTSFLFVAGRTLKSLLLHSRKLWPLPRRVA